MSYEQRVTHKDNKTSKTLFNTLIIVPIAFSIISAHCITRRELQSAFKMLLMKENTVITLKDLRSKHAQGTSAAGQYEMRRAEGWRR